MISQVSYRQNGDCFYKINHNLKRITRLENNVVIYLDYNTDIDEIMQYKSVKMNAWKHKENSFFISRHFEWEYDGKKFRTTDKPIEWLKNEFGSSKAVVFHNGCIWNLSMTNYYYPRIYLERKKYVVPTREVLFEKDISDTEEFIQKQNSIPNTAKWTDVKYCRHFEEIVESVKVKKTKKKK
jgi:hypothetical protein